VQARAQPEGGVEPVAPGEAIVAEIEGAPGLKAVGIAEAIAAADLGIHGEVPPEAPEAVVVRGAEEEFPAPIIAPRLHGNVAHIAIAR
jgi:hypothetical protein